MIIEKLRFIVKNGLHVFNQRLKLLQKSLLIALHFFYKEQIYCTLLFFRLELFISHHFKYYGIKFILFEQNDAGNKMLHY